MVKNPPASAGDAKDAVQSLGQEDPPEKRMATHSRILAWRVPRTEEPGGLQTMERVGGGEEADTAERLTLSHFHLPLCP